MTQISVRATKLGKWYVVNESRYRRSLSEVIGGFIRRPFRAIQQTAPEKWGAPSGIWALRDITFQVETGKVMGVIGRNGSGKSTFLKILARITTPTEGEAELNGRVGALLEVGTGFHPDLSGRENILLNGTMLGMTPKEIKKREDEIITFSEVGDFIDTPVKHYSSGMFTRLAFAVAAHLDCEVMLVDEVLAVGDKGFQEKCKAKIRQIANTGRTVLFTSHDMESIRTLCHSCITLDHGRIVAADNVRECIETYEKISGASEGQIAEKSGT